MLITVLVGAFSFKVLGVNLELFITNRCRVDDNSVKMRRVDADKVENPYVAGAHKMGDLLMEPSLEDSVKLILLKQNVDLAIR